jgi:hypothetical protein
MRRALVALLLAVACKAQAPDTTGPTELQVVFAPVVRDSLARAWNDTDPQQHERAACLTFAVERVPVNRLRVTLTGFLRPDTVVTSTTYSISFRCPPHTLDLHTHPPVSCPIIGAFDHDWKRCVIGGESAWLCFASDQDKKSLAAMNRPIGFVQCDRYAIIPFFPLESPGAK